MTVFCVMVQNTVSPVVEQEHYKEENKIESRVSLYTKWTDSAFCGYAKEKPDNFQI